jgi:hypothetical protein
METNLYAHPTLIGMFIIEEQPDGWQSRLGDELLGQRYMTAQHALDDLAGGHSNWPGTTDPSRLGLPSEIGDWLTGGR